MEWVVTYRSAGLVVVEIHFSRSVLPRSPVSTNSLLNRKPKPMLSLQPPHFQTHIGGGRRAASVRLALHMRVVAGARLDRALRAGARHRVRDARARYRVDERRLSTTCCKETPS